MTLRRDLFQRGDRLGEYEILQRLRAGGMATLFLGRRHGAAGVSRPIVIKVIHPHLAEDELIVKMFIDEARISSHISHSNVVYIERFGEQDGVYFMAMEYVDGYSIDQLLKTLNQRSRVTPIEVAVHIIAEAASGVHAAHETTGEDGTPLHIVHRDISPSNILLTRDGRVKLIDFGIAKARGRLAGTKTGGSLKGKLRYMAPEQARGQEVDRRTDIYSLGLTLWELLTCRPLFRGKDELEILDQVRDPKVPSPRTFNPDVPIALESVLARAMAKDPEHRHQTALELRREILRAVPQATEVPIEQIGELVTLVQETVGPVLDEPEDKQTTPMTPRALTPVSGIRLRTDPLAPTTGSAAGQVTQPPARSRRWVIPSVAVLVCGVGITAFVAGRSGRDDGHPAKAPPPPVVESVVDAHGAAVAPEVTQTPAPTIDAGASDVAATQVTAPQPAKPIKRPGHGGKPTGSIDVDGTVLATDSKKPTSTHKRPSKEVHTEDGTVLAK